jgi:SNF2 family DNA or RNA helicase
LRLSSTQSLLRNRRWRRSATSRRRGVYERREKLHGFEQIKPVPLPTEGLVGDAIPIPESRFRLAHFLLEDGFGGCLADEMGLGKDAVRFIFLTFAAKIGRK